MMKEYEKRRFRLNVVATFAAIAMTAALAVSAAYMVGLSIHTSDIQESRTELFLSECNDINERHDNAIAALDILVSKAAQEQAPREELREFRVSVALLINALAPRRDCQERVRELVEIE